MYAHKSKLWIWLCQWRSFLSLLSELGGWETESSLGSWDFVATLLAVGYWLRNYAVREDWAAENSPNKDHCGSSALLQLPEVRKCALVRGGEQSFRGFLEIIGHWHLLCYYYCMLGHVLCLTVCADPESWPMIEGFDLISTHMCWKFLEVGKWILVVLVVGRCMRERRWQLSSILEKSFQKCCLYIKSWIKKSVYVHTHTYTHRYG